jgi:NAD(P)-dependent dehydrogenase (short-subunit alcohol dehydrogenase family)
VFRGAVAIVTGGASGFGRGLTRRTLDGVARNRAVVVFPWYARLLWALWRFAPALVVPLILKSVRDVRRTRTA